MASCLPIKKDNLTSGLVRQFIHNSNLVKGIESSDFLVQKATDGQFGRVTKATNCEVSAYFELIRLDLKSI